MEQHKKEGGELKSEAKVITKGLLETALRQKEGREDINVKSFAVKPGSLAGENYTTITFAVTVTTDDNGDQKVYDLFLKVAHNKELLKDMVLRKGKVFHKEGEAYSEIVRDMLRYQTERSMEPIGPSVPSFYYCLANDSNGILILENIKPLGYVLANKIDGLNYEQCKIVMKELSVFHSLAYALKDGNSENMKKYQYIFHDCVFRSSLPSFFKQALGSSVQWVKQISNDSTLRERVESLTKLDLDSTFKSLIKPEEPYALICHGDMWCNNMLFKYDGNKPMDVKLLDLQAVRYALPTTDLSYLFYTSTTRKLRKQHLTELLHLYHSSFMECLNNLNLTFEAFTFDVFEKLFKKKVMYGVLMACMVLPGILVRPENLGEFKGETQADYDVYVEEVCKAMGGNEENIPVIRDRLVGAIEDAVEMGVL